MIGSVGRELISKETESFLVGPRALGIDVSIQNDSILFILVFGVGGRSVSVRYYCKTL